MEPEAMVGQAAADCWREGTCLEPSKAARTPTPCRGRAPGENPIHLPSKQDYSISPVRSTGFLLKIYMRILAFTISYLF